jgi:hypothetical protein
MTPRERRQRRKQHDQDKGVLDHLMGDLTKPVSRHAGDGADLRGDEPRRYGAENGEVLERGIEREWTPANGGLPIF